MRSILLNFFEISSSRKDFFKEAVVFLSIEIYHQNQFMKKKVRFKIKN